jgi:hypothetical protein
MHLHSILSKKALIAAIAAAAPIFSGAPLAYASSDLTQTAQNRQDPGQDFNDAVRYCTDNLVNSVSDEDQSTVRDYLIERYAPGADQQRIIKNSVNIVNEGNGALKLVGQIADTDGNDSGQVINAEFSVGSYMMDLLATYGRPPWNLPAKVTSWAMPCLQAAFILDGQAGSALGQSMRGQVFPPASTMPASQLPSDLGPIDLPH